MKCLPGCSDAFTPETLEMIKNAAFDIIGKIGMRATDKTLCRTLLGNGFSLRDGRLTYPEAEAASFLAALIAREESKRDEKNDDGKPPEGRRVLDGWINNYPHSFCDPETGKIMPYTMDSLTEMTAFCNRVCKKYNFTPNVPGCPKDVPPACEAVARFVVGSKYLDGGTYPEPMCRHSTKYLFEMCDVLGRRMSSLPVYLSTPLTIGDESFFNVLEYQNRLESVHIGSMPSFGASTPLSVSGGIALILAEVLMGAIIVNRLTGLETHIGVSLLPFDFKDVNLVFGTPEMPLLHSICNGFNNALFNRAGNGGGVEIHTHALRPDSQAAAEKAMAMTVGYMTHVEWEPISFRGMGALAMDEVFSPAQLLVDAELLNYIRRLDAGYEVDRIPNDFLDEIRDGIEYGFISSQRTASRHRQLMYHSDLFTRANFGKQMQAGFPGLETRAAAAAMSELAREPEMALAPDAARALDRLLEESVKNAGKRIKP